MSPGWMRLPSSSQTEMAMLPVLSATLHERTSCPSFVFVTRPDRQKRGKVSKVETPHADGNFVKRNIASGPFKKTDELTTCVLHPRCGANYLPISSTMKTIFKFFDPGFTSLIKTKVSVVVLAIVNF